MQIRTFEVLSDTELANFRAELAVHLGDEEAALPSWWRRAAQGPDGGWRLAYRVAAVDNARGRRPRFVTMTGTIPDVLTLLTSEANPEAELARQEKAFEAAARAEQEELVRQRNAAAERKAQEEEHRRRRPERWAKLPKLERALFVASAMASDEGMGASKALRTLAQLLAGHEHALAEPSRFFEPEARA